MITDESVLFARVSERVYKILHELLGNNSTIDLRKGPEGRVRIKVVSPLLNGLSEAEKGNLIWDALEKNMKEDIGKISYVVAYSTDEL